MRSRLSLMILATFFGIFSSCAQDISWNVLKKNIRSSFPDVEHITTDSLHTRLASGPEPVLFDVRTAEEYAVSHLAGARRVPPDTLEAAFLDTLARDTPIVAYCSVGYRSSAFVERLREKGFTNVSNLEGSIFEWANRGYPVYREGEVVQQVHPYDKQWGLLLKRDLRTYVPK